MHIINAAACASCFSITYLLGAAFSWQSICISHTFWCFTGVTVSNQCRCYCAVLRSGYKYQRSVWWDVCVKWAWCPHIQLWSGFIPELKSCSWVWYRIIWSTESMLWPSRMNPSYISGPSGFIRAVHTQHIPHGLCIIKLVMTIGSSARRWLNYSCGWIL